jgi:hypothetical protein
MPLLKFDDPLRVEGNVIKAQGDLGLDSGEELEELCLKIFRDGRLLAEAHGSSRHPGSMTIEPGQGNAPAKWKTDMKITGGDPSGTERAVAAATAMTDGPGSAMSAYQWVQEVTLQLPGSTGSA